MKFYKIQTGGSVRYYKNLTKLCHCEGLESEYNKIYYACIRQEKHTWSNGTTTVDVLFWSDCE